MNDIKAQVNPVHELDRALHCIANVLDECKLHPYDYNRLTTAFINISEIKESLKNVKL